MVDFASSSGLVATYLNWSHVRPAGNYSSQLWPSRGKNLSKCFDLNGVGALWGVSFEVRCQAEGIGRHHGNGSG
jgi:hypothetical protein